MERVLWRWMWRFLGLAAALTVALSVATGVILAHVHIKPAPWVGMLVVVVAALMAAGGLLPAMQHDMRKHLGPRGAPAQGASRDKDPPSP